MFEINILELSFMFISIGLVGLVFLLLVSLIRGNKVVSQKYDYKYNGEIISIRQPKDIEELAIGDYGLLITKDLNNRIEKMIPYKTNSENEVIVSLAIGDEIIEIPAIIKNSSKSTIEIVYEGKELYDLWTETNLRKIKHRYAILSLSPEYKKSLNLNNSL